MVRSFFAPSAEQQSHYPTFKEVEEIQTKGDIIVATGNISPPLSVQWQREIALNTVDLSPNRLYGIVSDGSLVALDRATGDQQWVSTARYLPGFLTRQGNRLFAYRLSEGFGYIDDNGASASERLVASFGASSSAALCAPVIDDRMVYFAVNQGLYAIHQEQGLQFAEVLGATTPHEIVLVGQRDIIVINGAGVPRRYRVGSDGVEAVWTGEPHGFSPHYILHPWVIVGPRLIISVGTDTVAYNLSDGTVAWRLPGTRAVSIAADDGLVYAATHAAAVTAISASDGAILWHRQYLYEPASPREHGVALSNGYLYYGCLMVNHPDDALLIGLDRVDGTYSWLSRAINAPWGGGIPSSDGQQVVVYGGTRTTALVPLSSAPATSGEQILATPTPLRGPAASFGSGTIHIDLQTPARVTIAAYRERTGIGSLIVNRTNWSSGVHEVTWNPAGHFTDNNQFGHLLFDIEETSGRTYTVTKLVPVNTFPDIIKHWARFNIEIMVYNRYVSGYPDQLFRADNLVTRAESCTIIAKTLGLEAPSAGFQTMFSDIGSHWARSHIMALEERGIVGGFAEPDGTFTFRPDLNMTRGQEARILVRAYSIPPAPVGFESQFTDIGSHWARVDIVALEAAGFVAGYREPDGTYTYRPEQNLTRAELCTLVVRIRELHR